MAYTLKLTDGKILTTLPDQQSDNLTTSLTLIGKNVNAYGTDINQNYIRLLENFAFTSQPRSPLEGQLWFSTVEQRIKVYTRSGQFKPVGGPIISATQPITVVPGDFWFDSDARQLNLIDQNNEPIVIGPSYDSSIGKSGWVTEQFTASDLSTQTVVNLYANNTLLGILSDRAFTMSSTLTSITNVGVGFNANYNSTAKTQFYGTATSALTLTGRFGTILPETILVDAPGLTITNALSISTNTQSLSIGKNKDFQFYVQGANTTATMLIGGQNEDFQLRINSANNVNKPPVFNVNGSTARLGIFNTNPTVDVDINGSVNINGNLSVSGSSTFITSSNLLISDKTVELAYSTETYSNALADGGGIILHAGVDKTITWGSTYDAWTFSTHVDLQNTSLAYKIGGVDVLTQGTLAASVTQAPGLIQVGPLTTATIGQLKFDNSTIGATVFGTVITVGDSNTANINFAGKKLFNALGPSSSDSRSTVATKGYVDDTAGVAANQKPVVTIDVTGIADSPEDPRLDAYVIDMLTRLLPPGDDEPDPAFRTPNGSRARVLAIRYTTPEQLNVPSEFIDLGLRVLVDSGGIQNSASVVGYSTAIRASTNIPGTNLGINRCIKQYIVSGGIWAGLIYSGSSNIVYTDGTW
jgi:hypothetical protein